MVAKSWLVTDLGSGDAQRLPVIGTFVMLSAPPGPGEIQTKTGWHVTIVTIVTCNCCVTASHVMPGLVLMLFVVNSQCWIEYFISNMNCEPYGGPGLCNGVLISVTLWQELISIPKMSLNLDIVPALTSVIIKHIAVTILIFNMFSFVDKISHSQQRWKTIKKRPDERRVKGKKYIHAMQIMG